MLTSSWTTEAPSPPRLHFDDDTGGSTGKIWVGSLGRHLTTTL
ncbi:hypothetical protein OG762_41835 [Streptomyces sp. NBC_01136]|nr:hypothetical protein OG762_41835 [Streptomyces sp. NBC_01136]